MSADFKPVIKNYKNLPPFKGMVIQQFPFIEEDFDAITNYQLLCKVVEYLKSIYNNEILLEENMTNLYNAYVKLENYVNDFFSDLNLQEEVNNWLDNAVESGELENILYDYTNVTRVFDTCIEMKSAEGLLAGQKVKTLGYYEINDGGGSDYYITDDASVTDFQEELENGKYASLVIENGEVNVNQCGAYGDGTHDDTVAIQKAIDTHNTVILTKGTYIINDMLIGENRTHIVGEDRSNTTIKWGDKPSVVKAILKIGERSVVENINFKGSEEENLDISTYGNFKNIGIDLTGSSYNTIRNCRFTYLLSGVLMHNSWCDIFENCYCVRCNTGFDSQNGSNNNDITFLNCQIERNNVGAFLGEGRTQSFYNCDVENNLISGISKWNEGDIQIVNTYFEDKINIRYGQTYTSNILISGCVFYQNPTESTEAYIPITYHGDANYTKITIMNCNFKNGSDNSETHETICLTQSGNRNTIKPILINNTVYQMKEIDNSIFKGIIIKDGEIKNYNNKYYTYINATDDETTSLSLNSYNKFRVNLAESGNHNIIIPLVDDRYLGYEFDFIVTDNVPSTRQGIATLISDTGGNILGDNTIDITDKNKLIRLIYVGFFNNTYNWQVTK